MPAMANVAETQPKSHTIQYAKKKSPKNIHNLHNYSTIKQNVYLYGVVEIFKLDIVDVGLGHPTDTLVYFSCY